nr:hypothetical protein [Tanacetum cinerariifolium]
MTNKIDTALKAITDLIAGALPSNTVKNPKLNVNTTTSVVSGRSYPTEDPQCSSHIHGSINAIRIHPKQQSDPHNDEPTESEEEEKDSLENTNTNPSASHNPSVSFITEKFLKINFASLGLAPQLSSTKFVCTKGDDGDVMLLETSILSGADNHPPMLEKDMYDSWKSRMELYMMNIQHRRMILESVENGPLLWPTVKENRVTRPEKYYELSATKAIQSDCDVKATNIILQGLPPEVYALVRNHKVSKELWERIQLLMQGTSLTKQERELNTKFLSTLPPEWSKFVTDVKLVRDLHTTNVDQLHAYLGQHEFHANEVRLMHKRNSDPLDLVANHQMTQSPYQTHQQSYQHTQFQLQVSSFQSSQYGLPYQSSQYGSHAQSSTPFSITYPSNDFQSSVHHNLYNLS